MFMQDSLSKFKIVHNTKHPIKQPVEIYVDDIISVQQLFQSSSEQATKTFLIRLKFYQVSLEQSLIILWEKNQSLTCLV